MYTLWIQNGYICQKSVFTRLVAVLTALFLVVLLTIWQPNSNPTATKWQPNSNPTATKWQPIGNPTATKEKPQLFSWG